MGLYISKCPFCGSSCGIKHGADKGENTVRVYCTKKRCDTRGPKRLTKHGAVKAWNNQSIYLEGYPKKKKPKQSVPSHSYGQQEHSEVLAALER